MSELSIDEIKITSKNVLKYFINYCHKNNLKYVASYGTVLGAIRHSGFIPWDDDIDVMMLREDYENFINNFDNSGRYKLICYKKNKNYQVPYAKLYDSYTNLYQDYGYNEEYELGVYIDIFPMDYIPDEKEKALKYMEQAKKIIKCLGYSKYKFNSVKGNKLLRLTKMLYLIPFKFIGSTFFINKIERKINRFKSQTNTIACVVAAYDVEYYDKNILLDTVEVKFEDINIVVPRNYKEYLRITYGNWEELPPIQNRISHHKMTAFYNHEGEINYD